MDRINQARDFTPAEREMQTRIEMEQRVRMDIRPTANPIQNQIDETHKRAQILGDRLASLQSRLEPVLLPRLDGCTKGMGVNGGPACPLSDSITRISEVLESSFDVLNEIEARLVL